jgi:hypothetical protein
MKHVLICFLAGMLLLCVQMTTVMAQDAQDAKQQLVISLNQPGPYKLDVNLFDGSMKIVTYSGKDIIVDTEFGTARKAKKAVKENEKDMKQITTGNKINLQVESKDNQVTIKSGMHDKPLLVTIKIPGNNTKLKLGTTRGGNIEVNNSSAEIEIENTTGDINLSNISGPVVANTVQGNITVGFKSVNPKMPMAFSTLAGNIDLTFPVNGKVSFKLKSDYGKIFSDYDISLEPKRQTASQKDQQGVQVVSTDNWIYGKINGGGAEVMVKNMKGNIYIRKSK